MVGLGGFGPFMSPFAAYVPACYRSRSISSLKAAFEIVESTSTRQNFLEAYVQDTNRSQILTNYTKGSKTAENQSEAS